MYHKAEAVICNSHDTLESLVRINPKLKNKSHVIGNPINVDVIIKSNNSSSEFEISTLPKGAKYICGIGRLSRQKRFDVLIKAFSLIEDEDLHLVILGEGELRGTLSRLVDRLNLTNRVHLPGFIDKPEQILRGAKLFVLSSEWEGFGNVLVEALACGVPIVSTNCAGGPRMILKNGEYGCLVPVNDTYRLSKAIVNSIKDEKANKRIGRINRANDFSSRKISEQYLKAILPPQ